MEIWRHEKCRRLTTSAINMVRKSHIWGERNISDAPRAGPGSIAEPSLPQYALFLVQFTLDYVKKLLLLARRGAIAWCRLRLRVLVATSHRFMALLLQLANLCLLSTLASNHHLGLKRAGTTTLVVWRQLQNCQGVLGSCPQQKLLRVVSQACEACLAGIYLHKLGKELKLWQLLGKVLLLKISWWLSELWLGHQMWRMDLLRSIQIRILDKIIAHLIFPYQVIWWRCNSVNGYRFNNPRESGSIGATD